LGFAFLLCLPSPAFSQASLRSAEFMSAANDGFAKLYNLDFDAADAVFSGLAKQYPDHPAPPLYEATLAWLRHLDDCRELEFDHFVHPSYFNRVACPMDPASRQHFLDLLAGSRSLADRRLKANSKDSDARYYRGAVEGLAAVFAVTVDRSYLDAFRHGQQAYALQKSLFQEDPHYFDASMLPGLFDYLSAEFPWYLRWLAGGDRRRGLQWVNLAVDKGLWAPDDARLIRSALLEHEGRPSDALADAASLSQKYPRNYLLHLAKAQLQETMGRRDEANATYMQILRLAEEKKPNYQRIQVTALQWEIGNRLLASQPRAALEHYQSILSDPAADERWRVLALLQSGCAFDLLGRREDAIRQYQLVLGMREYDNSHAHAHRYLQTPFSVVGNSIALPRLLETNDPILGPAVR
jgi:hypothetical protein